MVMQNVSWPGWEIVRVIGHGGFGTVYEIQRDIFGRMEKAALKVISIPQSSEEIEELYNEGYDAATITDHFRDYLEDVIREYSLMLGMKGHTNVVYCDDLRYVQHEDGIGWDIYIKMELLNPLTKALGKDYDERQTIRLGMDLCNALILCRRENIVHRDIKPQNIFVSRTGDYKLGDFGVAKISEKTASGTKIGTYEYMAPEVYRGQAYGSSADLYSLGLVMYWMMNERRTPFLPAPPQMPTVSMKEEARNRRFSGDALPNPIHGSAALRRIVLKACAFDQKDRYTNPEQLRAELEALDRSYGEMPEEATVLERAVQKPAAKESAYRMDAAKLDSQNRQTRVAQPSQPQGSPYRMDGAQVENRQTKMPLQNQPQGSPYRMNASQRDPWEWQTKVEQPAQAAPRQPEPPKAAAQPAKEAVPNLDNILSYDQFQKAPAAKKQPAAKSQPQNSQPAKSQAAGSVDNVQSYNQFRNSAAAKKQKKGGPKLALVMLIAAFLFVVGLMLKDAFDKPEDGFQQIDGDTYYYQNGEAHVGWLEYGTDTYHFESTGVMSVGPRLIDGETYYFFENGRMATGETELREDEVHVFDEEGRFQYRLICTRYPETLQSEEEVEFPSGEESSATGYYNLIKSGALECVSAHFRVELTQVTEGVAPTVWAMRIRKNGEWEKVANFEMYNNVGNCYVSFEDPVSFDAFIANSDEDCDPWSGMLRMEILELWRKDYTYGLLDDIVY